MTFLFNLLTNTNTFTSWIPPEKIDNEPILSHDKQQLHFPVNFPHLITVHLSPVRIYIEAITFYVEINLCLSRGILLHLNLIRFFIPLINSHTNQI